MSLRERILAIPLPGGILITSLSPSDWRGDAGLVATLSDRYSGRKLSVRIAGSSTDEQINDLVSSAGDDLMAGPIAAPKRPSSPRTPATSSKATSKAKTPAKSKLARRRRAVPA